MRSHFIQSLATSVAVLGIVLSLLHGTSAAQLVVLAAQQGTVDSDGDGVMNINDNAPGTFNPFQEDTDNDGIGDAIDPTLMTSNPSLGDPGLGIYSPASISPGGTAAFPYTVLIEPPGSFGQIELDFNADATPELIYFGPLTTGINMLQIPAILYTSPLWDLYTPGTYTAGMLAYAPGMSSLYPALPNITVVPEPAAVVLAMLAGAVLMVWRRAASR
jgi:hypothetical protein